MNTVELLTGIAGSIRKNPGLINEIDICEIDRMIYLDLQCRRQLYPAHQLEETERFFGGMLTEVTNAAEKNNPFAMEKALSVLASYVGVLPDSVYVSDFVEQANMDHLRLEHILEKTIYVIGDSHVNFFSGNEELSFIPVGNGINTCKKKGALPFSVFHMGPCLAYNSNRYGTSNRFREKLDYLLEDIIEANSAIMFVMGEIDLRVHVFRQCIKRDCTYEKVVDEIIDHYIDMMKKVGEQGHKIFCFGPIASQSDSVHADEEFVKSGTEIERNRATAYFTKKLEEKCADENIRFTSIFDKMVSEDGYTRSELLCKDGCHLGQASIGIVKDELVKAGLLKI